MNYYINRLIDEFLYCRTILRKKKLRSRDIPNPFFIVSCGRSGTTLLRRQLMENAFVHIPPESDDNISDSIKYYIKNINKSWVELVEGVLALWMNSNCFHYWDLDLNKNKRELFGCNIGEQNLASIIDYIYCEHRKKHNPDALTWGDKTPYSINRLKWIKMLFPTSIFIHQIRDGRNVVLSRMKYFNESKELASNKWNWSLKSWEEFKSPNKHLFKYEELVKNNEQTLKNIIQTLSLSKRTLSSDIVNLGDDILPHHEGLHKRINKDHLYSYQKSPDILTKDIEKKLKYYLEKYGYM